MKDLLIARINENMAKNSTVKAQSFNLVNVPKQIATTYAYMQQHPHRWFSLYDIEEMHPEGGKSSSSQNFVPLHDSDLIESRPVMGRYGRMITEYKVKDANKPLILKENISSLPRENQVQEEQELLFDLLAFFVSRELQFNEDRLFKIYQQLINIMRRWNKGEALDDIEIYDYADIRDSGIALEDRKISAKSFLKKLKALYNK